MDYRILMFKRDWIHNEFWRCVDFWKRLPLYHYPPDMEQELRELCIQRKNKLLYMLDDVQKELSALEEHLPKEFIGAVKE